MASRSTVIQPTSFELPLLQVPFEMIAAKLQQGQLAKDEYDTLSAQMPNYLPQHSTDASKYKQLVDRVSGDVAQAFASGDTSKAMRLLQQGKQFVAKQWEPNGLAYALNTAYNADLAAKKQLEENFKKDRDSGNNINYQYAQGQYKVPELGYNPDTGTFNVPQAPNVPTYFDYRKEMLDYVKAAKPEIKEISKIQGDYIWDEKGQQYHVPGIMQGFMADPRVQQQLGIESQFQLSRMSPEEQQAYADKLTEAQKQKYVQVVSEMGSIEQMLKSTDKEKRREGQAKLKELGLYTGKLDGDIGPKSLAAIDGLRGQVANSEPTGVAVQDLPGILSQQAASKLIGTAESMLPDQYSLTVNQANWRAKLNAETAAKRSMLKEYVDMWSTGGLNAFPTDAPAEAFNSVKVAVEAAKTNYDNLNAAVDADAKKLGFGSSDKLVEAFKNPANKDLFLRNPKLAEAVQGLIQAKVAYDNTQSQIKQVTEVYVNGKGSKEYDDFLKNPDVSEAGINKQLLIKNPAQAERAYITSQLSKMYDITQPGITQTQGYKTALAGLRKKNLVKDFYTKQSAAIEKDVAENYDKYQTTKRQGLRDNSSEFKAVEDYAKSGGFEHLADEQGNFGWSTFDNKKKGYNEPSDKVKVNRNSIKTSIMSDLEGQGVTLEMVGEDTDGKIVRRNVHIENPSQMAFMQRWAKKVLADGLNGKESPEAVMLATRIAYGVNNANRAIKPETQGTKGVVFNQGVSLGTTDITVAETLGDKSNTSLITYYDDLGNQIFAVAEQPSPGIFNIQPGVFSGQAVYDETEYDKAEGAFNIMKAGMSGDIQQYFKKRQASDLIPKSELGLDIINP